MKKIFLLALLLLPTIAFAQVEITSMRVNRLNNPVGIAPDESVTFSWICKSQTTNNFQTAYEIVVSEQGRKIWSSGKVESDNSTVVRYEGPLKSDSRYTWSLRVWDKDKKVSKRCTASWATGLTTADWQAKWIGVKSQKTQPIHLRHETSIKKRIARATAYVTAHGIYEAFINGERVGEYELTPGWTSYNKQLQYQAYDVTKLLTAGNNAITAVVTPGWYSGGMNYGKVEKRYIYGDNIALLMQVHIHYTDGSTQIIKSGEDWLMGDNSIKASGIVYSNIYDGQIIDARLYDKCWITTSYKAEGWNKATVLDMPTNHIVATVNEPVKVYKAIKPIKYIVTPAGEKVLDFGQNIVGWERVYLKGKAGDVVKISHAEILDKHGNFYTTNLRKAKATSLYTLSGNEDYFEPRHTFYGFRYLRVEGVEGDLNLDDFEVIPVWSSFDNVGSYNSSNKVINQLQSNIWWGFHDNFVDVPTDCPQRDERLGWTADAQVFFRTATFLGRVDTFFRKWLSDLRVDQRSNGCVPKIIPDTFPKENHRTASTGWADAATIVPWLHYMAYGDSDILAKQYDSMKAWTDYVIGVSRDRDWLWNDNFNDHYGDWLFWTKDNDRDGQAAVTSKFLIAQCFFANSVDIMCRAAMLLGKNDDMLYYGDIAKKVRDAYCREYVTPNGLISSDTQTAYVLALHFNMLPEDMRPKAVARLVDNIKRYKYHITTGFLGTPYICNVLTDYGHSDVAYKLLLQKSCPSWIYPISKGATTIWERWDSVRPNGDIIKGMNSFNHYSLGAIGDWLYRSAVGIREEEPGYKSIIIRPHTGGDFENMEAKTETPYGDVAAAWKAEKNVLTHLDVEIPFNTSAKIYVPAASADNVVCSDAAVKAVGAKDGWVEYNVGCGKYSFTVK